MLIRLALVGILLFGLLLRISYLHELVHAPDFSIPQLDAGFHDYWARGMVTGDWTVPGYFSDPEIRVSPYIRPPGYPFFLALIYLLCGLNYMAPRIVQMGLGLVNCVLAYLLGKKIFGRGTGLISAAFMSMYWAFIYFEGELVAPVLLVTLALLLIHVLRLWYDRPTPWRAIAGGITLGVLALVRPNILLFAPVVLAWAWWVAYRKNDGRRIGMTCLAFCVGAVMVIAPATIRNYLVAHDFVMITSPNAGMNLYIGNNEEANGIYSGVPALERITGQERWNNFDYPKIVRGVGALQGKRMKFSEVSTYFARKALHYMLNHPARILKLMAIKTALFWGPMEVSNNKEIHYERLNSPTLRHIPGFPIAISFALVGVMQLFFYRRRQGQNGAVPLVTNREYEMAVLILLFIVTYFVSFLPFFVAERFRIPIIPFLFLFGAYGLYLIGQKWASHGFGTAAIWGTICIVLYFVTSKPIVPYKPNPSEWHLSRGIVYNYAHKYDNAVRELKEAVRLRPDFANAHISLAIALANEGKTDKAIEHYDKALRLNPRSIKAHNNLGVALFGKGKIEQAIQQFREALRIRPGFADAQINLKRVLGEKRKIDNEIAGVKEKLGIKPMDPTLHYTLGALYQRKGEWDKAIREFNKALSIKPTLTGALNNLALVYTIKKQYDKAVSTFKKLIGLQPERAGAYYNIACIYAKQNKIEDSIYWLRQAIVMGYNNWGLIKTDRDLENIRGSQYYKKIMRAHGH